LDSPSEILPQIEIFPYFTDLNFPLLSDFNKTAIRAYDTIYEEFPAFGLKGVAKRSAYVIDKEGIVKYAEICDSPGDEPNYDAMKETLSSLN